MPRERRSFWTRESSWKISDALLMTQISKEDYTDFPDVSTDCVSVESFPNRCNQRFLGFFRNLSRENWTFRPKLNIVDKIFKTNKHPSPKNIQYPNTKC